jgi:ABC-type nitrate/sulfonate/bicarbonate transport system substrate-binding protein
MSPRILKLGAAAILLLFEVSLACAQNVPTIRFGRQTGAEDNLWLMIAKPELAPNMNKAYKVEWNQFRASMDAFKAYEAGQTDIVSTAAGAVIAGASKGLDFKIIASISRESASGAHTRFLAKADGPKTIADLKGTAIGIIGYRSAVELWAREALKQGGLNADRDVTFVVVPFPAVPEAVRSGKIGAGAVTSLAYAPERNKPDLKVLFTSKTGVPFDEELIVATANPDFLKKQPAAVRAFLSDLVTVTNYWQANMKQARQALLDARLVALPPEIYLDMEEYIRAPGLRPSMDVLSKMQDLMVSTGFQESRVDISKLVDLSFLPSN